jgi:competence protein ComEA
MLSFNYLVPTYRAEPMRWYFSRKEQYALAILIVAIVGALLVVSYACGRRTRAGDNRQFFTPAPAVTPEHSPAHAQPETPPAATAEESVVVHVTGAVMHPGVYTLPGGARVNDAVKQAGGPTANGHPDGLNLAAKLEDGEKIYVPTVAEWKQLTTQQGCPPLVESSTPHPATSSAADATPAGSSSKTVSASTTKAPATSRSAKKALPTHKISINTATVDEMSATLPGVGPGTAQRIVDYRTQHGKFTDLAQLREVPRIGQKTLDRLIPYISL